LNKTGDNVGSNLNNTVLNNLQLNADFTGLLILDNQEKLDKLTNITQNLQNTINGIQKDG